MFVNSRYFLFFLFIFSLFSTSSLVASEDNKSFLIISVDDKNYTSNNFPKDFLNLSSKKKKLFLSRFVNYKIILDTLLDYQKKYKQTVSKNLTDKRAENERRGIFLSQTDMLLFTQQETLDSIAYEEIALNHPKLENEIINFYESHKNDYNVPDCIEISIIMNDNEDKIKSIQKKLDNNASLYLFSSLAKEYSMDKISKNNGGYIGYTTLNKAKVFFTPLWSFEKLGLYDKTIKYKDHFYLVYIHKKIKASFIPLSEVKNDIRKFILKKEKDKWIDERFKKILKKTKITVYSDKEIN